MSSRKRWNNIYPAANPFALAQVVMHELNTCKCGGLSNDMVEYVWIHLPVGRADQAASHRHLSEEDWLSVIDESAANGANTVILTLDGPFAQRPEVYGIADWAQSTHDMLVGFHFRGYIPTREEGALIARLHRNKTRVLINREHLDTVRFLAEMGIQLIPANGLDRNEAPHECTLPKSMACLGPDGNMYTCGLVLGQDPYHMGNYFDCRLDQCIHDDSLPHTVPPEVARESHHCDGCPPLMAERLRDQSA